MTKPPSDFSRFEHLSFDSFRKMAKEDSLSQYEKIGFPDSYREGKEPAIFRDILQKLPALREKNRIVLDIGPGCSDLPRLIIEQCQRQQDQLLLVDSAEMLSHLPDFDFIRKYDAYYPKCDALFAEFSGRIDAVIAYSVLHYVFVEGNIWDFLDKSISLLAAGGTLLLGDVPNVSKRKRFFSSDAGAQYHRVFTGKEELPEIAFNRPEDQKIDDSVIVGLLLRARSAGCDAYVVPQSEDLPMSNRREDILVRRP